MCSKGVSRKDLFFLAVMALLLIPSLSAHGAMFTDIVAFGDSLSDNGNLFRITAHVIPDSSNYYEGRFSNGPVWVEYMASQLGANLDDLAYGGAGTDGSFLPPGLEVQIAIWEVQGNSSQGLFSVWAGANDYLRLGQTDAQAAVDNVISGLETLVGDGVSQILILNLPDLGLTPDLLSKSVSKQAEATAYSVAFNQGIAESLISLSGNYPGAVIYFLDAYGLFKELVADPQAYGFQNATDVSPDFGVDFQNEGGYVFWDGVHPTTQAHALLAQKAAALLSEDCAKLDGDLRLHLFLVEYAGMRFEFALSYIGGIATDPEGFYWEMDLATLGVESDNILGIDHVVAGDDLDLMVPCAEYDGYRYAFILDFVGSGGAGSFLWRLDVSSLMVK